MSKNPFCRTHDRYHTTAEPAGSANFSSLRVSPFTRSLGTGLGRAVGFLGFYVGSTSLGKVELLGALLARSRFCRHECHAVDQSTFLRVVQNLRVPVAAK